MPRTQRSAVRAVLLALLVVASTSVAGVSIAASTPGDSAETSTEAMQPIEDSELSNGLLGSTTANHLEGDDPAYIGNALARNLENETRTRAIILFEQQPDVAKIRQQSESRSDLVGTLKSNTKGVQSNTVSTLSQLQMNGEVDSYNRYWLVNAIAVNGSAEAINRLKDQPNVAAIVKDKRVELPTRGPIAPNQQPVDVETEPLLSTNANPDYGSSPGDNDSVAWGVERINADDAQAEGYTGDGARVAVIDTGVDASHPDLNGQVVAWKDFVYGMSEPYDDNGHGTHVAGTIAGSGEAGLQTGVAPDADIIGAKALSSGGGGYISDIIAAVQWSVAQDADVISMSLGGPSSSFFNQAMENAHSAGAIPVVSSGNLPSSNNLVMPADRFVEVGYPGIVENTITVGATNPLGRRAYFSAYQTDSRSDVKPEIVAPGVSIESAFSTYLDEDGTRDRYTKMSGTSMAAPHVSGVAALVLAERPDMTLSEFETLLQQTAEEIGPPGTDDKHGFGRLDANAALAAVEATKNVTADATVTNNGSALNITATVTDDAGNAVTNETVNVTVLSDSPEQLNVAKQNAANYVANKSVTTDANGTATLTVTDIPQKTAQTGDFTVAAAVDGGLWADTASVDVGSNIDIQVTSDKDEYQSSDNATLTVSTMENGSAVNATVDLTILGPTGQITPQMAADGDFTHTVTTGNDGTATVTVPLPEGYVQGVAPEGYVPGYGQYDVELNATTVNGTQTAHNAFASNVFTFGLEYTDLAFDTPQQTIGDFQFQILSGRIDIGSTQTVRLATTNPNTEYTIRLYKGAEQGFSGVDFENATVEQTLGTVTTNNDGNAATEVTIPETIPGGDYWVVASKSTTNLSTITSKSQFTTRGDIDVGKVQIEAMEVDIEFKPRNSSTDNALQVGDTMEVRVEFRNASTGNLTNPSDVTFETEFLKGIAFSNPTPGVYQAAKSVTDTSPDYEYSVYPTVRLAGTDQNGGQFGETSDGDDGGGGILATVTEGPEESAFAAYHEVFVTYNQTDVEPGDSVKMTFHVSDRSTGEPVENAQISTETIGFMDRTTPWDFIWNTWKSTANVTTDEDGTASVVFDVPPGAGEHTAHHDISTQYTVEKGDLVTRNQLTALDLSHPSTYAEMPTVELSIENSTSVGGESLLTNYAPGETVTVSVDLKNMDAAAVPASDRWLDVYVEKISAYGLKNMHGDLLESQSAGVQLDEDGHGTFTYTVPEDAEPGTISIGVTGRLGSRAIMGAYTGGVVADNLSVDAPNTAATGDTITVSATGGLQESTDVDFVLRQANSPDSTPQMTRTGDSIKSTYEAMRDYSNASLNFSQQYVNRLPDSAVANESRLAKSLASAMTPALMQAAGQLSTDAGPVSVSTSDSTGPSDGATYETNISLPENLPAGEYKVVAMAHSDQSDAETRAIGSTSVTVHDSDRQQVTRTIALEKGWNLVSMPADTQVSVSELQDTTGGTDDPILKAVTMSDDGYQPVDTLTSETAYWVFATESTSVDVTGYRIGERAYQTDDDWQLVGSLSGSASVSDAFMDPSDLQVQFVTWDASAGEYTVVDETEAGQGYWLIADSSGTIELVTPPSSPSSSSSATTNATAT